MTNKITEREKVQRFPLQIYLDTMDYSRFADIGHRQVPPGTDKVLVFLREMKAKGLIEVCYSWVHLFEFLKNPDERALALRKIQIIEELCGDLCFRYVTDVFDKERKALGTDADFRQQAMSIAGEWFPETSIDQDTLKSLENIAKQLRLLPKGQATVLLKQMSAQMPLSGFYEAGLLEDLAEGRLGSAAFHRAFAKGVAGKPRLFIERYLEGNPLARKMFEDFVAGERTIQEVLVKSRKRLLSFKDKVGGEQEMRRYVKNAPWVPSVEKLGLEALPEEIREQLGTGRLLPELPATSTFFNLLSAYMRRIFYPSHSMPEIKESDAADIMHAIYLPYVTFLRTDVGFGDLLKTIPKPPGCIVVSRLRDLPGLIEERLA